jgi:hypothetical protein
MSLKALVISLSLLLMSAGAYSQKAADLRFPFPVLTTYPGPQGLSPSPWYTVTVSQRGAEQRSFVYMVNNIGLAQNNWQQHAWNNSTELTTSFTSFDFNDPGATFSTPGIAPVTVRVTMPVPTPAWRSPAVRILPSASQIVPSSVVQVDGTYQVSFEVHFATQYSVEFYDAAAAPDFSTWVPANPLLIFANPLEHDVPRPDAPNVRVLRPGEPIPVSGSWGTRHGVAVDTLIFTPGIYDLGQVASSVNTGIYALHSDQTIYIAGGAYIKGAFVSCPTPTRCADAKNITIRGRGILSGENFNRPYAGVSFESLAADLPAVIQLQGSDFDGQYNGQQRAHIEGLTVIQAPFDNIFLSGIDNWVDNVKVISWYPSTDGIKAGNDYEIEGVEYPGHGVVENSFLKDGDDSIHLYSTGLRVNNVVIWQSQNASPFEFSSGLAGSIDDVQVINSNVIHTEWIYANMANAVFAANLGGQGNKGYDLGYTFDEIHIENSAWQLCRLSIVPTVWQFGNTQLGSLSNLHFHNIFVKDPQALPSLFKSYDRVHQISNVTFNNVIVAGELQSQPQITFDANRSMSLSGDIITEPLWIDTSGAANPNVQVWDMQQGQPTTSPVTTVVTLDEPFLNDPTLKLLRRGDFFGDGFASPLIFDPANASLGIWAEPLNPNSTPGKLGDYTAATIPSGYQFAGVGDFTGDGISGVLLWNASLQQGLILTMQGTDLTVSREIEPSNHSSTWRVAGIGDFDLNGVSDVVLRDAAGNLEILYQGPGGVTSVQDLTTAQLGYVATPLFIQNNPTLPPTGEFDSSWKVAGVGAINNYAAILWINDQAEIGITQFAFPSGKPHGNVVAVIPEGMNLQGLGDFNGDGSIDLLLHNPSTGEVAFWYMGWMGGNFYQPAPATAVEISGAWQN